MKLGVGLRGMRERILQLGGSMEIDSNGPGTVVRVQVPVAHTAETAAARNPNQERTRPAFFLGT